MNTKIMINKILKLANHLDKKGLAKEANSVDSILSSLTQLLGAGSIVDSDNDNQEDIDEEAEKEIGKLEEDINKILKKHDIDEDSDLAKDIISWCEEHEHKEMRSGGESEEMMEAEERAIDKL